MRIPLPWLAEYLAIPYMFYDNRVSEILFISDVQHNMATVHVKSRRMTYPIPTYIFNCVFGINDFNLI